LSLRNKGKENLCLWKTKIKKTFVFENKEKQRKVKKKRKVVFYGKMYSGMKSAMRDDCKLDELYHISIWKYEIKGDSENIWNRILVSILYKPSFIVHFEIENTSYIIKFIKFTIVLHRRLHSTVHFAIKHNFSFFLYFSLFFFVFKDKGFLYLCFSKTKIFVTFVSQRQRFSLSLFFKDKDFSYLCLCFKEKLKIK
jgi:hypothetical protein